jgi:hypothetical protein
MHIGDQCANVPMQPAAANAGAPETMHDDTRAALRLLVLALEAHPEDLEILQVYGSMAEHLADLIDDYIDTDEDEDGD